MSKPVEGFTHIGDGLPVSQADLKAARERYLSQRRKASERRKAKREAIPPNASAAQAAQKPATTQAVIVDLSETASGAMQGSTQAGNMPPREKPLPQADNMEKCQAVRGTNGTSADNADMPEAPQAEQAAIPHKPVRSHSSTPEYGQAPPEHLLRGRPQTWTPEAAQPWKDAIILHTEDGQGLRGFCENAAPQGPTRSTVYRWLDDDPIFRDRYTRAREIGADRLAEDINEIADSVADAGPQDSARVNAARLRVDARKWVASKLKPKSYADKLETTSTQNVTVTHKLSDDDRALALASLMRRQAIQTATDMPSAMRVIEHQATPKPEDGDASSGQ